MQVERSVVIRVAPEAAFAFLTHVENAPRWQVTTIETRQTSPGAMGVGATLSHKARFLGRRIENSGTVMEYEPHRVFAYRGGETPPVDICYRFEPVVEGTKVSVTYGGEPGGFFKLAEPLVARATAKLLEGDLAKLKQVLEA